MAKQWIQEADDAMEAKGSKGSFGTATPKKIAAGIKKGGVQEKKAILPPKNMKAIRRQSVRSGKKGVNALSTSPVAQERYFQQRESGHVAETGRQR